ncbi:hypothetical protein AcW1_003276 [Taiwanofungus camphoratus]|nr:hypothetical protein AcV7_005991 [Antrodia cinnamomea]KAI0942719.1 hypothetical protein AcW1_003276 [Antrodia cinnamomea]
MIDFLALYFIEDCIVHPKSRPKSQFDGSTLLDSMVPGVWQPRAFLIIAGTLHPLQYWQTAPLSVYLCYSILPLAHCSPVGESGLFSPRTPHGGRYQVGLDLASH